jgi:3-oxocholest-4-en-26-oate---CoA ligase
MSVPRYNLAAVHQAVSAAVPNRDGIVFRDRRLPFAEITRRSHRLAHALHQRGVGIDTGRRASLARHESAPDHLAIYAHNGNEYLESMLGAFAARVAPVNVNYWYSASELHYVLEHSAASGVVFHSAVAPALAEVLPRLPQVRTLLQVADKSGIALLPGAEWYEDALAAARDAVPGWASGWSPEDRYILYTDGTSGPPTGELWRHADIHHTAMGGRSPLTREPWPTLDAIADAASSTPPEIVCPVAPLTHGAGHWLALLALNQGWTVVIPEVGNPFDPAELCRLVERERVTYLQIGGDGFARPILDELDSAPHDVSSLRTIRSVGTALAPSSKRRLLQHLPHVAVVEDGGPFDADSLR